MTETLNEPEKQKQALIGAFHDYQQELLRFLTSKLGNAQDAEDVTQELFIKITELNTVSISNIKEPKHYLFKIATNASIDFIRKKARQNVHFTDAENVDLENTMESANQPDRIWEGRQQADRLRAALAAMPAKRRQAFLLFKYRNLTRTEIANELDLSVDAVEKHILRALKDCRDYLKRGDA